MPDHSSAVTPLVRKLFGLAILIVIMPSIGIAATASANADSVPIDRHALVTRHNPTVQSIDPESPFIVGNGRFAFTADVTGLQTFVHYYHTHGIPTETLARWAWHTNANPHHYKLADANELYDVYGKQMPFPTNASSPAGKWLRENPQDLPLGVIGLDLKDKHGQPLTPSDLTHIHQTLNLWTGTITSDYQIDGAPVHVETACHPTQDQVAFIIDSPLLENGRLGIRIAFPRGFDIQVKNNPPLDWSSGPGHVVRLQDAGPNRVLIHRSEDATHYETAVAWQGNAHLVNVSGDSFRLQADSDTHRLAFVVDFSPHTIAKDLPTATETIEASAAFWPRFWKSGGAIDFSGSTDPRAFELERRVILSQYLTATQFDGSVPPQETGLSCSSWYGKHNTEMIWWHVAHFALWGRDAFVKNALAWYIAHLPEARALAKQRGLSGARWAKMVGPNDRESPGGNPLIVWNQPQTIYLAELLYRNEPGRATLERYRKLVFETADCLASMLHWDAENDRYVLGPPLWISQEIYNQRKSMNPTFELSYWGYALEVAQHWRQRLGKPRLPLWDKILKNLSPLPVKDGRYVAMESIPDTFDNVDSRHDHPTMLAPLGVLPGFGVNRATMAKTLEAVLKTWDWKAKIWGWDYPMIAMTAARLGKPEEAVDILLKNGPNNFYTGDGNCPQHGDAHLPLYLPANGALLTAVAMMARGWDGAPPGAAPGFPKDGRWVVRSEGLHPLP